MSTVCSENCWSKFCFLSLLIEPWSDPFSAPCRLAKSCVERFWLKTKREKNHCGGKSAVAKPTPTRRDLAESVSTLFMFDIEREIEGCLALVCASQTGAEQKCIKQHTNIGLTLPFPHDSLEFSCSVFFFHLIWLSRMKTHRGCEWKFAVFLWKFLTEIGESWTWKCRGRGEASWCEGLRWFEATFRVSKCSCLSLCFSKVSPLLCLVSH